MRSQVVLFDPGQRRSDLFDLFEEFRLTDEHPGSAAGEGILQELGLKAKVEWYGDDPDFEASVVGQHDFEAVWQQKRHPIPGADSSLQQGCGQRSRELTEVCISIGLLLENQSNLVRIFGAYLV